MRSGTRLQDAQQCTVVRGSKGFSHLVAVVSDGAGTAEYGGQGASIMCRSMMGQVRKAIDEQEELPGEEDIWAGLDMARDRIQMAARRRRKTSRDFAATLVSLIASKDDVLTAHCGDGAIVARHRDTGEWLLLSPPQHGEYASTTYFVTDEPSPALRMERQRNVFDAFALFSDGIENLVLDPVTGAPSPAFFTPMIRPLVRSITLGRDRDLSAALAQFLAGENVNARTDDDKTLILAVQK